MYGKPKIGRQNMKHLMFHTFSWYFIQHKKKAAKIFKKSTCEGLSNVGNETAVLNLQSVGSVQ